jgi:hypothetical protein
MSLLDARTQLRAKDEELRRVHITNPGVFSGELCGVCVCEWNAAADWGAAELYEQGEQLGKGKFGVVYECTPRHDPSKRYAVKGKSAIAGFDCFFNHLFAASVELQGRGDQGFEQ